MPRPLLEHRRAARGAALVAGITAAGFCVSGCGPLHEGAAATVGHTRITVAQVNAGLPDALAANTSPTGDAGADHTTAVQYSLTSLIQDVLLDDAGKAKGISVSEADVQSFLADQRKNYGTDARTAQAYGVPLAELNEQAARGLLITKLEAAISPGQTDPNVLGQALGQFLVSFGKQVGVSVNPRYGTWDGEADGPTGLSVVSGNAFSSPAPVASAPPDTGGAIQLPVS